MEDYYLPSLLDRLVDHDPRKKEEGRDERRLTFSTYRQGVIRDLVNLLNSPSLPDQLTFSDEPKFPRDEQTGNGVSISSFPHVAGSVLNYGLPTFTGKFVRETDVLDWENKLAQTIERFEPRLSSIQVKIITADAARGEAEKKAVSEKVAMGIVSFEIQAELWAEPMPEQLYLKTELDLRTGHWDV